MVSLINKSSADAYWTLVHLPRGDTDPDEADALAVDDPTVFSFSSSQGCVKSHSTSLPRAIPAPFDVVPSRAFLQYQPSFLTLSLLNY